MCVCVCVCGGGGGGVFKISAKSFMIFQDLQKIPKILQGLCRALQGLYLWGLQVNVLRQTFKDLLKIFSNEFGNAKMSRVLFVYRKQQKWHLTGSLSLFCSFWISVFYCHQCDPQTLLDKVLCNHCGPI